MPKINKEDFTNRGWKEHYSGLPADLFYAPGAPDEPWATNPHLHLNYSMEGDLQSLTYKNARGENQQVYHHTQMGVWQEKVFEGIDDEELRNEAKFVKDSTE